MAKKPKKKQLNRWLILVNIPFQMAIVIVLFSYLGKWLDQKWDISNELFFKAMTLIGVLAAMVNTIRQVKNINRDDK